MFRRKSCTRADDVWSRLPAGVQRGDCVARVRRMAVRAVAPAGLYVVWRLCLVRELNCINCRRWSVVSVVARTTIRECSDRTRRSVDTIIRNNIYQYNYLAHRYSVAVWFLIWSFQSICAKLFLICYSYLS